jgi:hypothetical protein
MSAEGGIRFDDLLTGPFAQMAGVKSHSVGKKSPPRPEIRNPNNNGEYSPLNYRNRTPRDTMV